MGQTFNEFREAGGTMMATHKRLSIVEYTRMDGDDIENSTIDTLTDEVLSLVLTLPSKQIVFIEDTEDPLGFALDFIMDGCPIDRVEEYQGRLDSIQGGFAMNEQNFKRLEEDELQHRAHTEVLDYLVRDIDSIVDEFGMDNRQFLENRLVDLIIQNR